MMSSGRITLLNWSVYSPTAQNTFNIEPGSHREWTIENNKCRMLKSMMNCGRTTLLNGKVYSPIAQYTFNTEPGGHRERTIEN